MILNYAVTLTLLLLAVLCILRLWARSKMPSRTCVICGAVSPSIPIGSLRSDDLCSSLCPQCQDESAQALEVLVARGEATGVPIRMKKDHEAPRLRPPYSYAPTRRSLLPSNLSKPISQPACRTCGKSFSPSYFLEIIATESCQHPPSTCLYCVEQGIVATLELDLVESIACSECGSLMSSQDIWRLATNTTYERWE